MSKYLPIPLFVIAFVYATIFGFDYVILAFLIFLLITTIAKNFAKNKKEIKCLIIFFVFSSNLFALPSIKDVLTADDQGVAIDALLDGLHRDAHEGNFKTYFARYSSDAVFLGTDKTERWTIEEFKTYAKPAFADGHGWTYAVVERNWEGGGNTRWFDEILFNVKLGHCRGTGVVQLINGKWKITHYALTMLVPNAIAADVGSQTQEADKQEIIK